MASIEEDFDREAKRIENDINLTDDEKQDHMRDLEEDARGVHEQYLDDRNEVDRRYGY